MGIDGDSAQAQFIGSSKHSGRNFTAVGDQKFTDRLDLTHGVALWFARPVEQGILEPNRARLQP